MRLAGWGGRIRTSEWRNQNPLPYHLATPHHGPAIAADGIGPAGRRNIVADPSAINDEAGGFAFAAS